MTQEELLKEQELKKAQTAEPIQVVGSGQAANYGNTMAALKQAESALPVYSGSYDAEISELYGRIVNRESFTYSPAADPLYGIYRDQYQREGRRAMRDSAGQAADLTGGYGSSYAQAAGQQQYDQYLQKLNQVLPELYSAAYDRYKDKGDKLEQQLQTVRAMEETEYGRHRDDVTDAMYRQGVQKESFATLMDLIFKTGYQASQEELEAAGMSQTQAEALRNEFLRKNGLLPGSSGGSVWYGYSGGTGSNKAAVKLASAKKAASKGKDGRTMD